VQGFCPLFVVSLAPIIAQIAGIALCRNAFWVGQQTLLYQKKNAKCKGCTDFSGAALDVIC
jgi:hypothetical protein